MSVECATVDEVMVIRVRGSLDDTSAEALRQGAWSTLLGTQRTVFVNLLDLEQIDAAGLGALADVQRLAASVGGRVALTNLSPRVREILDATALTPCFEISASECDAIEDAELCLA
jgi:anti-anti-sigma factor